LKLTNENYVSEAERVIREIKDDAGKFGKIVTTSKIRKILAMVSDLYNRARHIIGNDLDGEMRSRIQYLKLHIVYEAGRDNEKGNPVKTFINKANLLSIIDDIGSSKEYLITFCHYMEALVAYRKYIGGKDE